MNKKEWNAMNQREKDGLIAERFMDLSWRVQDVASFSSMEKDLGKRFLCPSFTESDYSEAKGGEEKSSEWDRFFDNYTTDRNACYFVLNKVDLPVLLTHFLSVTGETDVDISGRAGTKAMCNLLLADPDTICYCAIRAAENEKETQ